MVAQVCRFRCISRSAEGISAGTRYALPRLYVYSDPPQLALIGLVRHRGCATASQRGNPAAS
jgi:hypothetical protein